MRAVLILCCLAVTCWSLPREQYVKGQFMVRLDERLIKTEIQERKMIQYLKDQYDMDQLKTQRVGRLKFLLVEGSDRFMGEISALEGVKYIERNTIGYVDQCLEQPSPGTYGLDRIDQREALSYSDPTSDAATYTYGEHQGEGVTVYVVDTGIDPSHENFDGRVRWGYNDPNMPSEDNHSHGTHCAGTVGSRDYGVAKDVDLVAVKVINRYGSGTADQFVGGMDWVLSDHLARQAAGGGVIPKSICSISLGYSPTQSIDDSVAELTANGIAIAVSAGNSDGDACEQSPARAPDAFGTGSTDVNDVTSYFSNYGPCVDIYAPGSDVLSTVPGDATSVYSGTSMAAPHVAGAMARFMSSVDHAPTPAEVFDFIQAQGTVDAISWYKDSHSVSDNLLLYSEC